MGIKLNLGCGNKVLEGYINVDHQSESGDEQYDAISWMRDRTEDSSISEIRADHLCEHIPFDREELFFYQAFRVLEGGGRLEVFVPDLNEICRLFYAARDNKFQWYKPGANDDYFGGRYDSGRKWSFLVASLFGHQDGSGQYHHNGYTEEKLKDIAGLTGFSGCIVTSYMRGKTPSLHATYIK